MKSLNDSGRKVFQHGCIWYRSRKADDITKAALEMYIPSQLNDEEMLIIGRSSNPMQLLTSLLELEEYSETGMEAEAG